MLGGTFDPVHLGHVALAQAALADGHLDSVIVMPAHIQPFKSGKEVAADEDRLAMARLAFAKLAGVEVSDYEMFHTEISYTYDTLCYLREQYPQSTLYFIMGTDSFLSVENWYKGISILENFSFIVSVRPGYREKDLEDKIRDVQARYHTEVLRLDAVMPDISSTKVREYRQSGRTVAGLVPAEVERYMDERGLYCGD